MDNDYYIKSILRLDDIQEENKLSNDSIKELKFIHVGMSHKQGKKLCVEFYDKHKNKFIIDFGQRLEKHFFDKTQYFRFDNHWNSDQRISTIKKHSNNKNVNNPYHELFYEMRILN